MDFEWDEAKRRSNLAKHGFDFVNAVLLLSGPHLTREARTVGEEKRWSTTGIICGDYVTMISTMRNGVTRVISLRKARHEEQRQYRKVFGR